MIRLLMNEHNYEHKLKYSEDVLARFVVDILFFLFVSSSSSSVFM